MKAGACMSFAHFNEINEICNGMLVKKKTVAKMKPRIKKRYVIKSRPLTQEQLLKEAEEESEKEGERLYVYMQRIPNHDLHGGDLFLYSIGILVKKNLEGTAEGLSQISAKNYINKTYFRKEETGFLPPMCKNTLCLKG
jgi:hypothetical protein